MQTTHCRWLNSAWGHWILLYYLSWCIMVAILACLPSTGLTKGFQLNGHAPS